MSTELKTLNVTEVAQILQSTVSTVLLEIRRGKLHAKKIGRSYRVTPQSVEQYLGIQPVQPAKEQK